MLGGLVTFLIVCIVLVVVLWGVKTVVDYMELPPPIRQIVLVIFALIFLIALVEAAMNAFGGGGFVIGGNRVIG
jgi:hypothetical protein